MVPDIDDGGLMKRRSLFGSHSPMCANTVSDGGTGSDPGVKRAGFGVADMEFSL